MPTTSTSSTCRVPARRLVLSASRRRVGYGESVELSICCGVALPTAAIADALQPPRAGPPLLVPGKNLVFAALGRPIESAFADGEHRTGAHTFLLPNGGRSVPVLVTFDHNEVVLAEGRSASFVLYGRPLHDGYLAFASRLRRSGWRIFRCRAGGEAATDTRSHTTTLVR